MEIPSIFKDSILGTLLLVNMVYLGWKIDKLAAAIYNGLKIKGRRRK